jgi:hypothetical protein
VELSVFVLISDWVLLEVVFAPCLYPVRLAPLVVLDWVMSFPWFTVELLLLLTVDKVPSQTFTPSPTELFEALTRLTPWAPSIAVPDKSTDPLVDVVMSELLVAIAPPAGCEVEVSPAVTLSI